MRTRWRRMAGAPAWLARSESATATPNADFDTDYADVRGFAPRALTPPTAASGLSRFFCSTASGSQCVPRLFHSCQRLVASRIRHRFGDDPVDRLDVGMRMTDMSWTDGSRRHEPGSVVNGLGKPLRREAVQQRKKGSLRGRRSFRCRRSKSANIRTIAVEIRVRSCRCRVVPVSMSKR